MPPAKKLIEVALPLDAINRASAREKSIRHGHPSTLHLWWARRPLAAARAVIFTSLVDDPDDPNANPAFVAACKALPGDGDNVKAKGDSPRMRLFDFIERLVTWEATTDETIMSQARELIRIATNGNPPPLLDPFAGGGSIPLEAQRLGLEAHASDLNPVAVMINKAMIEIPPRFADKPPVNPRDRADVLGTPHPPAPSPTRREGEFGAYEKWDVSPELEKRMRAVARDLRKNPTAAEERLWQAIRKKQILGRKFRRQMPIGAFVVDFYCPSERLVVEVDGGIHNNQQEADRLRQELIESLGIRFLRLTNEEIMRDLPGAIAKIQQSFSDFAQGEKSPSPPVGEGFGVGGDSTWKGAAGLAADARYYGEWMRDRAHERIGHLYPKHNGETVIAWLWARTVISPNPAVNAPVPLVSSFALSKKKGRKCWARPVIAGKTVRFEVTPGEPPKGQQGTMIRRQGAKCIISGEPITFDYIKQQSKAGRLGATLLAIVTEGKRGRNYHNPSAEHVQIAESAVPAWRPVGEMEEGNQNVRGRMWGLREFADLFTPRQLKALTTFSDLVKEARQIAVADAMLAGLAQDEIPLRQGGRGALAYGEAVSVYLTFALSRTTNRSATICIWNTLRESIEQVFGRQAIPMTWDFAEANLLSDSTGNWAGNMDWIGKVLEAMPRAAAQGSAYQEDAHNTNKDQNIIATDPPYYDNIGYADLSDFFYVWMRKTLSGMYPDIFATLLVPKASELIASAFRHGSKDEAKEYFEVGMFDAFANFRRLVRDDYPLTVYYAFKQQDAGFLGFNAKTDVASTGWETMLSSLVRAGFSIVGTWPMRTERATGLKAGVNALASSIVLVCRPRPADARATSRRRFLQALRAELPAAIAEMKTGSVAPVDMAQATIGPGMAIYSRYRAVLEADGTPLSVRAALGLINAALDEALEAQDAALDPETRFAIGWFEEGGFKAGDFGRADVLARGKNTSVESAELAGLVESAGGAVRLIHWKEYDPGAYDPSLDKRPTVWEGAHHLIERLNSHGETGAAALYNRLPGEVAESARDLAYRLYHVCERKGWAEDALDYNTLVSSWSEITRLAASARSSGIQQRAEM